MARVTFVSPSNKSPIHICCFWWVCNIPNMFTEKMDDFSVSSMTKLTTNVNKWRQARWAMILCNTGLWTMSSQELKDCAVAIDLNVDILVWGWKVCSKYLCPVFIWVNYLTKFNLSSFFVFFSELETTNQCIFILVW